MIWLALLYLYDNTAGWWRLKLLWSWYPVCPVCVSCWTLCSSASRGGWARPRPRPAPVMGVVLDLGQRDQIRTRGLGFEPNLKQETR